MNGSTKLFCAIAAAMLMHGCAIRAESERSPSIGTGSEALMARDLPENASEAEVRRHCTRKYDYASTSSDPTLLNWGLMSEAQLQEEFRRCLLRNGVRS